MSCDVTSCTAVCTHQRPVHLWHHTAQQAVHLSPVAGCYPCLMGASQAAEHAAVSKAHIRDGIIEICLWRMSYQVTFPGRTQAVAATLHDIAS